MKLNTLWQDLLKGLMCIGIESKTYKTYKQTYNDPLGQTQTTSDHYFHSTLLCFAIFWKVGTDGNMCENNDHYRPGLLLIGRVDQFFGPLPLSHPSFEVPSFIVAIFSLYFLSIYLDLVRTRLKWSKQRVVHLFTWLSKRKELSLF